MKTYATYGFYIALAGLAVSLLLFVTGMHSDPARVTAAGWIAMGSHWAFGIAFIALAVRARRDAADPAGEFSYGEALWAGSATALWTALFDLGTVPLYLGLINPGFTDVLAEAQRTAMEAKGIPAERIEQMERMQHLFMNPVAGALTAALGAAVGGTLVALVVAALLRRPAAAPRA
ncbi:MAG TPA: DUF4199 family protein [Opitutaceae bacterium]|nr:DUF4199 family protein [Opitutaceae bacterium]